MKDIKPISPLIYFERIKNSPVKEAALIIMVLKSIKGASAINKFLFI